MIERKRTGARAAWAVLLGAMLVVPLNLAVQPRGPRGMRGFRGGEMGPAMGMGMRFLRELGLSDEQRGQVRTLFEEARNTGTFERLRSSREALRDAIDNGADEGTLRQLAYEIGQAEGDAAVEAAHIQTRVQEILTEEQQAKWAQLKAEAKQKMEERRKEFEERRAKRGQRPQEP
jgi:Spy/CpxP family protein refolding chaperone